MSTAKKRTRESVTIEFPDNVVLSGLSGPHQKHFVRLEQKLARLQGRHGAHLETVA